MHVTKTQGEIVIDISLSKTEAEHLQAILNVSDRLWAAPGAKPAKLVEKTSYALFSKLSDAGIEPTEVEAK